MDMHELDDMVEFPTEIWINILSYLPLRNQKLLRLVSNQFRLIIDNLIENKVKWTLKITENNIKIIKNLMENEIFPKLNFRNLDLDNIKSINELRFILKKLGNHIERVKIEKTAAFDCVANYLGNLKHLQVHFDESLRRNFRFLNFNEFKYLEKLDFFENIERKMSAVTNRLLYKLRDPEFQISLKHLCLDVSTEVLENTLHVLNIHGSTLEYLEIMFFHPEPFPDILWGYISTNFQNLTTLHLSGPCDDFCDMIILNIPEETQLKEIHLDFANDEILILIVNKWKNSLQNLVLMDCDDITDEGAIELRFLNKLRLLTQIAQSATTPLPLCDYLCYLGNLSQCYRITSKGILRGIALENNSTIEELHLSNLTKLNERCISLMASRLTNLRILYLNKVTKGVTNASLAKISRFLIKLRSLSIDRCTKITDKGIIGFGKNPHSFKRLQYLEELNINGCSKLTNLVLFVGLNYQVLRTLNMCNCPKITFEGIEYLLENCPLLETFGIPDRYAKDNNALLAIRNCLKYLLRVNITFEYLLKANQKGDRVKDNIKGLFCGVSCGYNCS